MTAKITNSRSSRSAGRKALGGKVGEMGRDDRRKCRGAHARRLWAFHAGVNVPNSSSVIFST